MNLFDMLRRSDRNMAVTGEATIDKQRMFGGIWRGVRLAPGATLRLKNARRFYPLKAMPDFCGWYVMSAYSGGALEVALTASGAELAVSEEQFSAGKTPIPVTLPWVFVPQALPEAADLVLRNKSSLLGGGSAIFIGVHRALTRDALISAATGTGVEVGPGPHPQIMPSRNRQVSYVEQMPPDEWNRLYNKEGKYSVDPSLWKYYRIGEASNLPVEDNSLDFIFSSHVFEHLSNPFGHLERWSKKLKAGGLVLAVVPDLCGTKDALHEPSEMAEWLEEQAQEQWEPGLRHYVRHVTLNMPGQDPAKIMDQRRSIHAHYYTNTTMAKLLEYACKHLGYSWFRIEHTANHKDFHFMLSRA